MELDLRLKMDLKFLLKMAKHTNLIAKNVVKHLEIVIDNTIKYVENFLTLICLLLKAHVEMM